MDVRNDGAWLLGRWSSNEAEVSRHSLATRIDTLEEGTIARAAGQNRGRNDPADVTLPSGSTDRIAGTGDYMSGKRRVHHNKHSLISFCSVFSLAHAPAMFVQCDYAREAFDHFRSDDSAVRMSVPTTAKHTLSPPQRRGQTAKPPRRRRHIISVKVQYTLIAMVGPYPTRSLCRGIEIDNEAESHAMRQFAL